MHECLRLPPRCCFLDTLTAQRTNVLIVSLWIVANSGLDRFDSKVSDAPCGVALAVMLFASLVLVGHQHGCSRYAMLLNLSA